MVARSVTSATKNYVSKYSIYKMLLADGTKQQEPTGHGRRLLRSFLKNFPKRYRYFFSIAAINSAARWRLSGSLSRAMMRWSAETASGSPCSPSSRAWRSRSS